MQHDRDDNTSQLRHYRREESNQQVRRRPGPYITPQGDVDTDLIQHLPSGGTQPLKDQRLFCILD